MYGQINEDIAWQRVQDLQREMENSRLMTGGRAPATLAALRRIADLLAARGKRLIDATRELTTKTSRNRVA